MPKKDKKSGEKQNEDKKTAKNESSSTPTNKTESGDREKELYLIQIRYLNEQLERYQLKCDQLEKQKKDSDSQYSALEKEKKDIIEYLKRSLLGKEAEVDELTERLETQQQAAEQDREALKLHQGQLRQELQDRIDEVTAESRTLATRLAGLVEFQKQKEQLMTNMDTLEKKLSSQEEEHKIIIHSLEINALLEKKRLEKEMESHVAAMRAEVQHLVDQEVPETTRLALQENMEVKARISLLSQQTQALMEENSALRGRKSRLSVDVDVLEEMLSETSRKSCIQKKVVEQLTDKCQQLQVELNDCKQEVEQLQTRHTGDQADMETLRQDQASLSQQCSKTRAELSRLQAELQEEKRSSSWRKSIMRDAVIALRRALMHAPTDQDLEVDSALQWKQLMEMLLVVLDRPTPTESSAEDELQTSDPAAAGDVILDPGASFQVEQARYRPGDLGLGPRPTLKHKLSRTGAAASSRTHLPLHRKPTAQKTLGSFHQTDPCRNSLTKPK